MSSKKTTPNLGLVLSGRVIKKQPPRPNSTPVSSNRNDSNNKVSCVKDTVTRTFNNTVIGYELRGTIKGRNNVFNGPIYGRMECTNSTVNANVYGYANMGDNNNIYGKVYALDGTLTYDGTIKSGTKKKKLIKKKKITPRPLIFLTVRVGGKSP